MCLPTGCLFGPVPSASESRRSESSPQPTEFRRTNSKESKRDRLELVRSRKQAGKVQMDISCPTSEYGHRRIPRPAKTTAKPSEPASANTAHWSTASNRATSEKQNSLDTLAKYLKEAREKYTQQVDKRLNLLGQIEGLQAKLKQVQGELSDREKGLVTQRKEYEETGGNVEEARQAIEKAHQGTKPREGEKGHEESEAYEEGKARDGDKVRGKARAREKGKYRERSKSRGRSKARQGEKAHER